MAADTTPATAQSTHTWRNWSRASAGEVGVPSSATSRATPSTAPSWRAVWFSAPPAREPVGGQPGDRRGAEHREGEGDAQPADERSAGATGRGSRARCGSIAMHHTCAARTRGRRARAPCRTRRGRPACPVDRDSSGDHERSGGDRQPGLQRGVVPHGREEEHVGEEHGEEPDGVGHGGGVGEPGRARLEQAQVERRRGVAPGSAERRRRRARRPTREGAEHGGAGPAPVLALGDAEGDGGDGDGEEHDADEVGARAADLRLGEHPAGGDAGDERRPGGSRGTPTATRRRRSAASRATGRWPRRARRCRPTSRPPAAAARRGWPRAAGPAMRASAARRRPPAPPAGDQQLGARGRRRTAATRR